MARPESLRPFVLAAMVAAVVAAVWAFTAPRAAMPPVSPLGEQPLYSVADEASLALLEPVLHAPWLGSVTVPAGGIVGLIVILGATGVAIFAGASLLATSFIALALALDASFAAALAHAGSLVVAVGLVWLASGAAFDEHQRLSRDRPWFNPLSAILLWSLAVWWDWIAIVTWPIVLAALRRTPNRPARGWWTAVSLLLGAGAFVAHFEWMAAAARALSLAPSVSLTWRDAMSVAFSSRPRMPMGSFASAELTVRLTHLMLGLAVAGLVFGDLAQWWRRAVVLSGALVLAVGLGWPEWQAEVFRFAVWAVAPLAAVGLTWVSRQSPRRGLAPVITCGLGGVLLAETVVMGARPLAGAEARVFRNVLESALNARTSGRRMVLVAEDTRIDSAVASWASTGQGVMRVTQDGEAVASAVESGHLVLAGPAARRNLELTGIVFAEAFAISEPASFTVSEATSTLQCAIVRADRWSQLPGLEYTGRLGLQLPPQFGGELQLIVGDALPLQLQATTPEGREVPIRAEALMTGPGRQAPPPDLWLDGGLPENGPAVIRRLHFPASPARTTLVSLRLGRRAPRVLARLIGYDDVMRGRVCAAPLGRTTLFADDRRDESVPLANDEAFGSGWYGLEGRGDWAFRWAGPDAVVLLTSAIRTGVTVTLDAEGATLGSATGDAVGPGLTLRVNGVEVATRQMASGQQRYRWNVPAGLWLAGTNELWWHTPRAVRPADIGGTDTRTLALRVSSIRVERE
jgi:hypothetical protein